ncbi:MULTISPECIES: TetR/AcrR family transcriptional regulator [unclassified Knoellia]|uniref:TetR/AcrR family transcriptional regulator n=1 Tax=Knoellia altitudinis TaxID=3404795 RepID=UPI003621B394
MSAARDRLLTTATELFYAHGLHSVGIDRIVATAGVTRATLYRHFPSKDDLIVAYLSQADDALRARAAAVRAEGASPDEAIRTIARAIADDIERKGFRGCAFLNAAAEFPDASHPVHRAVLAHRTWFLDTMTALFAETGKGDEEAAARHFVMLRDGAMSAGCLADPEAVSETLLLGVKGLLTYRSRR